MPTCLFALLPDVRPPEPLLACADECSVSTTIWSLDRQSEAPPTSRFDGLVIVGGSISAYDRRLPHEALARLITRSVGRNIPTLGMGAGAHLVSWALGGRPSMPEEPTPFGLRRVNRTAHGRLDGLFGRAASATEWIEWSHLALTDLPVGSEVLAVDESGMPQAVRFGPCAWGLQGHPYVDRSGVEDCLETGTGGDYSPETLARLAAAATRMDDVSSSWEPLHRHFFHIVSGQTVCC